MHLANWVHSLFRLDIQYELKNREGADCKRLQTHTLQGQKVSVETPFSMVLSSEQTKSTLAPKRAITFAVTGNSGRPF